MDKKVSEKNKDFVLIASRQAGLIVKSANPYYKYVFEKEGEPVKVAKSHVDKVLTNLTFYVVKDVI